MLLCFLPWVSQFLIKPKRWTSLMRNNSCELRFAVKIRFSDTWPWNDSLRPPIVGKSSYFPMRRMIACAWLHCWPPADAPVREPTGNWTSRGECWATRTKSSAKPR